MQTSADEHIVVASIPSIDDDFQPENEISEEVLNMLLIWQKKNKASLKNEAPAIFNLGRSVHLHMQSCTVFRRPLSPIPCLPLPFLSFDLCSFTNRPA